jgi:hypothetical protein
MLRPVCAASVIIGAMVMSSAWAAPPVPEPALDLGQTSFLDGEAGPGGLLEVVGNGYVASQFMDAGGRAARRRGADPIRDIAPERAGNAAIHRRGPGRRDRRAIHPVDKASGLGAAAFGPARHPGHGAHGQYSRSDPINAGSDAWQISPYLAFTWRVADRWEISGRSIYDWSGRSGRPPASLGAANTQAGAQFAQNLSVSAAVTDSWRIGVAGYGLWQLDDARVDGRYVPKSREQVIGVGPA